jgi:hypothetical protein
MFGIGYSERISFSSTDPSVANKGNALAKHSLRMTRSSFLFAKSTGHRQQSVVILSEAKNLIHTCTFAWMRWRFKGADPRLRLSDFGGQASVVPARALTCARMRCWSFVQILRSLTREKLGEALPQDDVLVFGSGGVGGLELASMRLP